MPWWVAVYFLAFGTVTAFWVKSELPDRAERPYTVAELASEACLVAVALAYWVPALRVAIGSIAPMLFVAGCAWLPIAWVREWRQYEPDQEMSRGLSVASVVVGVGLYALLSSPLLYWGFSYVVQGSVAST